MSTIAGSVAISAYQQDFSQLTSALSSNDLAGAREAFANLKEQPSGNSQFLGLPLPTPIKNDLESLSTALQKGNMEAAQQAFSSLMADLNAHYLSSADSANISLLG